LFGVR